MGFADFSHGQQFFQQRREFQFGEQLAQCLSVRLSHLHRVLVQFNRDVAIDGHQLFAKQNVLAVVLQRLAIGPLLDFCRPIQRLFHRSEPLNQVNRTFVPDSRSTRNVVNGITAQGHHIHHSLRRHSQNLFDLLRIANQIVFRRIQDLYPVVHQLQHVLIAGNHIHRM